MVRAEFAVTPSRFEFRVIIVNEYEHCPLICRFGVAYVGIVSMCPFVVFTVVLGVEGAEFYLLAPTGVHPRDPLQTTS